MTEVHGTCDERFIAMREHLAANLASGADLGASVAVTLDGEPVVDMWGGWADTAETGRGRRTRSPTSGRPPRR